MRTESGKTQRPPASIHFNMDDLMVNLSVTRNRLQAPIDQDPTFGPITDRILQVLDRYGIKATFFILGKSLEESSSREKILNLHQLSHEIANHSCSHPYDLRKLTSAEIHEEILGFDRICKEYDLPKAKGFTAPGWNINHETLQILVDAGYEYDCSLFPSFFKTLASLSLWSFSGFQNKLWMIRSEEFSHPFALKKPHLYKTPNGSIWLLPFPCISFPRIPIYHTMFLMLRRPQWLKWTLQRFLKTGLPLPYLFHPMDFLDPDRDLKHLPELASMIPRGLIPFKERMDMIETALQFISENYQIQTLGNLTKQIASC